MPRKISKDSPCYGCCNLKSWDNGTAGYGCKYWQKTQISPSEVTECTAKGKPCDDPWTFGRIVEIKPDGTLVVDMEGYGKK